jgi:diguanylate cyclase (GGDEF)-like protein
MARRVKVCVTDDEPELTEVLCEGLRLHNFDAVSASSGEQALDVCGKGDVDLVLLDVMMPGMDGYEVCKRLKANPATKDTSVIFVTGRDEPADHEQGFDLGAVDYITKPFNLPMVMVRVEAAMRMKYAVDPSPLDTDGLVDTAYTDTVTGLRNQRFVLERLQEELDRSARHDFPVTCAILDVDKMSAVDPETGPVAVDDLLAEAAMAMNVFTRSYDVLGRYDGTLFVAILPHATLAQGMEYGKKCMDDIDATTFADPNQPTKAEISVAVVTVHPGTVDAADDVFGAAMRELLKAKSQARGNRISGAEITSPLD